MELYRSYEMEINKNYSAMEAIALFPETSNEEEAQTENHGSTAVKSFYRKIEGKLLIFVTLFILPVLAFQEDRY